jgi:hypothetical protein
MLIRTSQLQSFSKVLKLLTVVAFHQYFQFYRLSLCEIYFDFRFIFLSVRMILGKLGSSFAHECHISKR